MQLCSTCTVMQCSTCPIRMPIRISPTCDMHMHMHIHMHMHMHMHMRHATCNMRHATCDMRAMRGADLHGSFS